MNQIKYIKMNLSVRNLKIQIKKIHNQYNKMYVQFIIIIITIYKPYNHFLV
jgi:hypothetical protein